MNPANLLIIAITCIIALGCSQDIGVSDVQFGTFTGIGTDTIKFKAENTLSKSNEVSYGWAFSIKNPPEKFIIREVTEGPTGVSWEAPANATEVEISNNGKTVSVTKTISKPNSPFLFHHWSISSVDPVGNYKSTLYLDDKLIKEVNFVVIN